MTRRLLAAAPGLDPHTELATDPVLLGQWAALTYPERRTLLLAAAWMARTNESKPAGLTEGHLAAQLLHLTRQWAAYRKGEGTLEWFCAEAHPAHDVAAQLAARSRGPGLLVLLTLTMHIPLEGRTT